ncbi:carboxymuconolactone decarboxylase family protein [Alteromonas sp. a30]|uniref:carboxymuconolactone decarboxylase family protein n=1 Tax=Alteromonas sp. a30 TaxID=2730917 RepID=UPI00227F553F|nr:carboxymuconolactone decarboxylase family protein [Alteromonas sp. a30]MCY7297277.1 carboxymuconolactone decarboxylase family protein [Alteromonas sp. a30]
MSNFTLHDQDSAPEASKPLLQKSIDAFGMVPNLHAVMAESPQLLEGYQRVHELFSNSSFDKDELTVVWQTINKAHSCGYCLPAHTAVAQMMGADESITESIKTDAKLPNAKLDVLRDTTLAMVESRGNLTDAQLDNFYSAGYTHQNLLDIVLGLSQKIMSNYTNHIAKTPLDEAFQQFA